MANPGVIGAVTFFYYEDLAAAAAWYRDVLGFAPTVIEDWLVLFSIMPNQHLGLVNADGGSQVPIRGDNKGAVFSIETDALEGWHRRLQDKGVDGLSTSLVSGCRGRTLEFRVRDPEGYTIEFFRWVTPPGR